MATRPSEAPEPGDTFWTSTHTLSAEVVRMEYTHSRLSQASTIGTLPMLTIHMRQSGPS
jgi:hypothetical protein